MIYNVDYHITDICNLNCASCLHFCPLVPKDAEHKSMEQITKDLTLLSKFKDHIEYISLMGGEPTLHPQLNDILYLTRKLFPNTNLRLFTNGLLWNKFEKWKDAIINNGYHLFISEYPYTENYKEHTQEIIKCIGEDTCAVLDNCMMYTGPLVLVRQNTNEQVLNCRMRNYCCQLKDEHLYICNYAAQIDYLYNEFPFLKNYIFREGYEKEDLNTATIDDIMAMLNYSIPAICFYCNECMRCTDKDGNRLLPIIELPWKQSEKRIEEWIS